MSDEVFGKIKDIITELLDVEGEKITLEARFREDLEADSLDLVELIMEFEENSVVRFQTKMLKRSLQSVRL